MSTKSAIVPVTKEQKAKFAAETIREAQKRGTGMKLDAIKNIGFGRRLSEFEVPPQLMVTVPSAIDFVDDAFGGEGVTPSMSIMLTGGPGCGKTTMCMMLADAFQKQGHIVNYNGLEEAVVQMRKAANRLHLAADFHVSSERMVAKTLDFLRTMQVKNPGKQVVGFFDSLQAHDDGKYANGGTNSMTAVRVMEMITDWCKEEHGGTYGIAFTVGMVNKNGDHAGKQQLIHTIDAHAHMYIEKAKKSEFYGERLFTIPKNRFGCSGRSYIVGMDKDRGLYQKVCLDNGVPVESSDAE